MSARKTVGNFLHRGQELFNLLHEDSEGLTNLDLQLVRSQLHMLEIQVTNIQSLRELRLKDVKTASYLEQIRRGN